MVRYIPFSPFPLHVAKGFARPFFRMGVSFTKIYRSLDLELKQAEIDATGEQYASIIIFLFFFYFIIFSALFTLVAMRIVPDRAIFLGVTFAGGLAFLLVIQVTIYPKILVKKKVRDVEKNLVYMLRTMLIQINSGVSLFDTMVLVSRSDFGVLSQEFRKAVVDINAGAFEGDVLQKMATLNPSTFFRRALWQIINGLKAGVDISAVMEEILGSLVKAQQNQIRRFGSALRVMSLVYMMMGVIIPSLSLTFIIVLSSFPQINITEVIFMLLLGVLIVAEFMYLGALKSRRPTLLEAL